MAKRHSRRSERRRDTRSPRRPSGSSEDYARVIGVSDMPGAWHDSDTENAMADAALIYDAREQQNMRSTAGKKGRVGVLRLAAPATLSRVRRKWYELEPMLKVLKEGWVVPRHQAIADFINEEFLKAIQRYNRNREGSFRANQAVFICEFWVLQYGGTSGFRMPIRLQFKDSWMHQMEGGQRDGKREKRGARHRR